MTRLLILIALSVSAETAPSLRGTITDPSGAAIPRATIQIRGPRGEQRTKTDGHGLYEFASVRAGTYRVRIVAKGFAPAEREVAIDRAIDLNAQLAIQSERAIITVDDAPHTVDSDPASNGGALILRGRQIAALSDDPDELALQLQTLAGPAPGPDGGQFYIDGFTAGAIPPKSAIREVRINANPFSPEYDKPGFSRVEIFTRPGSESFHGQAFFQYNNDLFNTRNPLLTQSTRPPYESKLFGFDFGGPIRKNRSSFTLAFDRRRIDENAFILATTPQGAISEALPAPQSRTMFAPRIDYAIDARNTLVVRYQELRIGLNNQGVGDFNLASRAYNESQTERTIQITETAALNSNIVNETRFQWLRVTVSDRVQSTAPGINVIGAFFDGGATVGNSGSTNSGWELTNLTSKTAGRHTLKWGARIRQSFLTDTSINNFAGTYTFFTLEQYMRDKPSQFSIAAGTPTTDVSQIDAGLFLNDDWRIRPNLTASIGARYETQSNAGDRSDIAPRVGLAWGIDGSVRRPAKTVIRGGFGFFYDRLPLTLTLNRLRYDGATQQSFLIVDPQFYPAIPSVADLRATNQPQQLRPVFAGIEAPRVYQTSVSIERQFSSSTRATLNWIGTRGTHLLNARNINTPIAGIYPYGDASLRLLTESAGLSRLNQLVANVSMNQKRTTLFGYYALSYGSDNNEGLPADPYNLRAEWGPSSYGDIRHRGVAGASIPLPLGFSANPFFVVNSGFPYNITTGLDPNNTGYPYARPSQFANCFEARCFDPNPAPGIATIPRNFGRGPAAVNLALRLSRSWRFGREGSSGLSQPSGHQQGMGPMFSEAVSNRRYVLTVSASTLNALNHPNFAPPNGDLSSPYFGQPRSLGGLMVMNHGGAPSTYNRKIDLQLRFSW